MIYDFQSAANLVEQQPQGEKAIAMAILAHAFAMRELALALNNISGSVSTIAMAEQTRAFNGR